MNIEHRTSNMPGRNMAAVAERQRKLASHNVAGSFRLEKECPEGTLERGKGPASLQDASIFCLIPATSWLADFQSRFATEGSFLHIPTIEYRKPARMAAWSFFSVLLVGLCLSAWNCGAQTNNASSGTTYESFQIVTRNNIFDPNRRYQNPNYHPQPHRQINRFSLVGTMSYPKGKFAFFDSPNADYKKVLEPGGSIAGYTVKDVTAKGITLAANGEEIEMKVGTQMTKGEGEKDWRLSGHVEQPENADATNEATDGQSSTVAPTGATPEMSDTLKKLMQQRQQELK